MKGEVERAADRCNLNGKHRSAACIHRFRVEGGGDK